MNTTCKSAPSRVPVSIFHDVSEFEVEIEAVQKRMKVVATDPSPTRMASEDLDIIDESVYLSSTENRLNRDCCGP